MHKNFIGLILVSVALSIFAYGDCFKCGGSGQVTCTICDGTGCTMDCQTCDGRGVQSVECYVCHGSGEKYSGGKCYTCKGSGYIQQKCMICRGTGCGSKCYTCRGTGIQRCSVCRRY